MALPILWRRNIFAVRDTFGLVLGFIRKQLGSTAAATGSTCDATGLEPEPHADPIAIGDATGLEPEPHADPIAIGDSLGQRHPNSAASLGQRHPNGAASLITLCEPDCVANPFGYRCQTAIRIAAIAFILEGWNNFQHHHGKQFNLDRKSLFDSKCLKVLLVAD